QNPHQVTAVEVLSPSIVSAQLSTIAKAFPIQAIKTGMLANAEIATIVADFLSKQTVPIVIDPVMVATSGAALLEPEAIQVYQEILLSLATLITPNLPEAEVLSQQFIRSEKDIQAAGEEILRRFGSPVLVKGGHFPSASTAKDWLFWKHGVEIFENQWVTSGASHGTGCTLSAAICANLALGKSLPEAIQLAKTYVNQSIQLSISHKKRLNSLIHAYFNP
ncbi:MAG: bifunctional hydroxymethylpyrimidine kinase/phosphomethylpyrimidine kinase, partial [Bacteroidia bacterium]|nr:bifunctional hydroxymethylpyrimidine kinase/phosphomethylpyrimidine kinase [Bacteroidia bacterium]